MVFATLTALMLSRPLSGHHQPKWLDQSLAGYAFEYDEKHGQAGVFDSKSGFFILREIDCDGAVVSLTLTKDRNIATSQGYLVPDFTPKTGSPGSNPLTVKSLPSLSTGKGVTIGDSGAQVQSRLGSPTLRHHTGERKQYVELVYSWKDGKADNDFRYTETYTFKAGKLIQIDFLREANGV
jgi:hypothetical protein